MDGWGGVTIWDFSFSFKFSFLPSLLPCDGGDSIAWYFFVTEGGFFCSSLHCWIVGGLVRLGRDYGVAISSVKRDKNTKNPPMRYIISI